MSIKRIKEFGRIFLSKRPDLKSGLSAFIRVQNVFRSVVFFIAFLTLLSLSGCTYLFFKPGKVFVDNPDVRRLSPQDVYFQSSDGLTLHAWYFRGQGAVQRGAILVCHGNVENISTHAKLDLWLVREGYNLFIFDYRGYGTSGGEPTVEGIHLDAEAALEKMLTLPGVHDRIIIFGKSLGGAVAIYTTAHTPYKGRIKGLIVESAFADYRMMARRAVARTVLGWPVQYPLSFLVNDDYSPLKWIKRVSPIPVLIMHGTGDPIVPVEHGRLLFKEALSPKEYWELPGLGHVKSWTDEATRARLLAWLDALPGHGK
jgi:fermentation-respiration switch protein FrsA (DUF1100 family)